MGCSASIEGSEVFKLSESDAVEALRTFLGAHPDHVNLVDKVSGRMLLCVLCGGPLLTGVLTTDMCRMATHL